ncbi:MAG: type II secretion system protein [Candidatus Omnitrophota bacterium]
MSMLKKAFTIIEILVILSVLGILISLAIPRIKGMMDNANIVKVKGELQTLQAALESYYTFTHTYPLKPNSSGTIYLVRDYLSVTSPQVLSTRLYDPFTTFSNVEYSYYWEPLVNSYFIWSAGVSGIGSYDNMQASHPSFCGDAIYVTNYVGIINFYPSGVGCP